jgi:hypothetical protein
VLDVRYRDGTLPDYLPGTGNHDWILYDVGGSRASVGCILLFDFGLSDTGNAGRL